jgi:DNA-binding response OmpR family regulator
MVETASAKERGRALARKHMTEKGKHTVLVVEDVEEISSNMSAALSKRGHHVEHASNADDAILLAEANRPAMILTDLDLPTFDKLLGLLRNHTTLKNVKVAIIDINSPHVTDSSVNVLTDFQGLDDLMDASSDGGPARS